MKKINQKNKPDQDQHTAEEILRSIAVAEEEQKLNNPQAAAEAYRKFLSGSKKLNAWIINYNLGKVLRDLGDLQGAKEAFAASLQEKPDFSLAKAALDSIPKNENRHARLTSDAVFFSVIVPTHKRPQLLQRAISSITQQISPVPFEVIVISDITDEGTDKVCRNLLSSNDTYIRRNGSSGPSASRNVGLLLAQGRYILFLDDDDAWHPNFLAQLYNQAAIQQGCPVYFNCSVAKESRLPEGPVTLSETVLNLEGGLTHDVFVRNQIHMSCLAYPRPILDGLLFDTHMRAYEDWDFQLAAYAREWPQHVPVLGSRIFEVDDATTDRRGQSHAARDFNAPLDYLYVYRRRAAPTEGLQRARAALLQKVGLEVSPEYL
jgi:hypothetical protein